MRERATANGMYSMGTYFGSALSTLSLIFAMWVGWRMTTTAAVISGIFAAALLCFFLRRFFLSPPLPPISPTTTGI